MRTPANSKNMTERYSAALRDFALVVAIAAGTLAERGWRGRVLVAGLIVMLCFVSLGLIDPRTIAQEVVGQDRSRTAMKATLLSVEQEKAQAATPGSDFKECANGCPVMIVIPAGKFIMGAPKNESDRNASEGPPHEVTIAKPFCRFQVRGDVRRVGCLRRRGCVPASPGSLGPWRDACYQRELGRRQTICDLALEVDR